MMLTNRRFSFREDVTIRVVRKRYQISFWTGKQASDIKHDLDNVPASALLIDESEAENGDTILTFEVEAAAAKEASDVV